MFGLPDDLVERIQRKDAEAFSVFYTKSVNRFYRYLKANYYLTDAEKDDLLSDFYLKCWTNIEKYDPMYSFETFVWTMFRNLLKDYFKKAKEVHPDDDELIDAAGASDDDVIGLLETDFQMEKIQQAMTCLDGPYQEVIFFKFIEEKSYEEISQILVIGQDAVRQRVSRALKKLKESLDTL